MNLRTAWDDLRTSRYFRAGAQVLVVVLLVGAGVVFGWRVDRLEAESTAIGSILAETCGAASFKELRDQGLVEECRLAQAGELDESLPDDELPPPGADPTEVDPDLIEDDVTSTPADVDPPTLPRGPSSEQVAEAVASYFSSNPLSAQDGYQRAIERAVTAYLSANPPSPGRPPTEGEIRSAVRTALLANPPSDGSDGADGRSVVSAVLDGCDVVFTYSNGSTDRVGPVCGSDGQPGPAPTDEQVAQAVVAYCTANGECRGPAGPPGVVQTADNCQPQPGEFVTDVTITGPTGDPATIAVSCTTSTLPIGPG